MIKLRKPTNNLIIGIILSYCFWVTINFEQHYIIYLLEINNLQKYQSLVEIISIIIKIVVCALILKGFYKLKNDKLSIYFIISIIGSIFIAGQFFLYSVYFFSIITEEIDSQKYYDFLETEVGSFILGNFIALCLLVVALVFLICFTLFINRKVKYIKYITKEIKTIEDEGFGQTISVKGYDELAQLSKSINNMSTKLKEKSDQEKLMENNKNELITNVSHDLRTPLTSIMGYVDLIKKDEFKDMEKLKEYVDIIDERTKNLNGLINELFEYTKLNSYDIKLNYTEVEFVGLIEQIVGEYVLMFNKEGLRLEKHITDKDITLNLDIEKIVRAIENLLTNAMKYSIPRSKVIVKLEEDDRNVIFSIANETDSIKKEDLENIFERFYKADKSRNEKDSSGLGLSIVKRIVELHKGTISVELNEEIITFKIIIPVL